MVKEEAQYDVVLKMVLWDESREAIFHRLEVNGVTGDRAEAIYQTARAERVGTLRAEGWRSLLIGLCLVGAALGIYFGLRLDQLQVMRFGEGFHGVPLLPWILGFLAAILLAFGVWKVVQGSVEIIIAPMKKGSIADR
ncbi:hypothetical protein N9Y81_02165 [Akkermansiaceae bacterium]|jgi:uncharacterized membrane protein|nr:hypothetical protein [Akkermansiaceae bacterium]